MSGEDGGGGSMQDRDALERAIAALEAQRDVLGADVIATATGPMRQRLASLEAERAGGRRKIVTVLFADLVDFTSLSRRLDPEDTRIVVNEYFRLWTAQIESRGGVVEKFIGDAVMAVFGLHRAREEDPHQAIRAALAVLNALPAFNATVGARQGAELAVRVGIDTGDVVVSDVDDRPGHAFVAVGETVNRASRLQGAAPVGTVLISAATYKHVRGRFGFHPRPGLQLKGIEEPTDAYVVVSERPRGFQLDPARGVEGIETRTVGRDLELRRLQEHFVDVAEESRRQVVTIIGEAGVGKTRLLLELDRWLAERPDDVWWFRGRASPSDRDRPGALLRDVLTARFGILDSDPPETVRLKCESGFERGLGQVGTVRQRANLVGSWLGLAMGDAPDLPALPQDPQSLRQQASAALAGYFAAVSEQAPLVIMLEDLHWADAGSLGWIDAAHDALAMTRMLVVCTARPALLEHRPHWGEGLDHHVRLNLRPLSRRSSRALLAELLRRTDDVPESLTDLLLTAAEGNPYYLEELVQWLLESGVVDRTGDRWRVVDDRLRQAQPPATLKGVLQARVDALPPPERLVLERASVIGRVFWDHAVDALAAARLGDDVVAADALDALRGRGVVHQRERTSFEGTREFVIEHALLRDVTYDGLLKAHRRAYHLLAATWLERTSAQTTREDEHAAAIAEHLDLAGDPRAAAWFLRAGRQASAVHAIEEAQQLLSRGLAAAPEPEAALRFDLLTMRAEVLDRAGDRPAQRADLDAMLALADHLTTDPVRRVTAMLAESRWSFASSEYDGASRAAQDAVALADRAVRPDLAAEGHLLHGKALTWSADHVGARRALGEALRLAREAALPRVIGETLRYRSMVSLNEGDFPTALALLREARVVYEAEDDPDGASTILAQMATVHYRLGRFAEARRRLEESLAIFRRSGFRYREAIALGNLASTAVGQGELGAARRWGTEALDLVQPLGDREAEANILNDLAVVAIAIGDWSTAQRHADVAQQIATSTGTTSILVDALVRGALAALGAGRLTDARAAATRAMELAPDLSSAVEQGYAAMAYGYVALTTGAPQDAAEGFAAAGAHFGRIGVAGSVRECAVGAARAALDAGDVDAAVTLVEPVLSYLAPSDLAGTMLPGHLLMSCVEALRAAGDGRFAAVLDAARSFVEVAADRIDEADMRAAFLAVPVNAALIELADESTRG